LVMENICRCRCGRSTDLQAAPALARTRYHGPAANRRTSSLHAVSTGPLLRVCLLAPILTSLIPRPQDPRPEQVLRTATSQQTAVISSPTTPA
jgi:hypothetical protein